ncbi:MAG: Threonyl-tRNA synthetase [Candidatus Ozemobacter sibiricus]|jgi:threonyl-tRNA synthetase|uniref:Threonine--tRNA ligase n=1 Tax=Candidatus Ozemobacter sibiricus TaxID=2268124 RepID=A0A367ZWD8_9BACT|nr:MAG: Threonyl-tRNA synthetase [Candidatus Ozemobacter sibiricus]
MSESIVLTLPDGKTLQVPVGATVKQAAAQIGPRLAEAAIAGKLDGKIVDLRQPLIASGKFEVITMKSPEAHDVCRHSMAHIMAEAVLKLFPGAKFGIGPAIENGFYYDFQLPRSLTPEDLEKIEKEMQASINRKQEFTREELDKEAARRLFSDLGQSFKLELIDEIPDAKVSVFRHGEFIDLCRGPHVPHTGVVKHFKLLNVAGAYWRGDERRPMLQRIYGTAFATKEELDKHLANLEEARKRDHRKLGKDLDLFSIHEEVGPGLVFWHPKGARIRHAVETFWKGQHYKNGYELIYTPHIGRSWLWETSGHLGFYRESMYSPMLIDEQEYYIKPMNCPFHIMIYKSSMRSYRDLPLRWAEMGTVYRYEKSGVLHGLMRVRGFTQDDAHIICTPEQIEDEVREVIRFSLMMLRSFGFEDFKAYLATRPEKAVGEPARWEQALAALKRAVDHEGLACEVDEGGGAFYGPKIDLKIKDALGREWQMTTIQFDFNLPERFDMTFVGQDGGHHRPYMVHRALLGSLERFMGVLLEYHGGNLPVWLAPVQVAVLPISDKHLDYARQVEAKLRAKGLRTFLDTRSDKINYKIRAAQLQKIPFMAVLGDAEASAGTITIRKQSGENLTGIALDDFLASQEWTKE